MCPPRLWAGIRWFLLAAVPQARALSPEPIDLTHIRVTLPRALFHENPASLVIEGLWGSRRKAGDYLMVAGGGEEEYPTGQSPVLGEDQTLDIRTQDERESVQRGLAANGSQNPL